MSSVAVAPTNALSAGQVLYAIKETSVISAPPAGSNAQYRRVSFAGSNKAPQAILGDPLELGASVEDIRTARAFSRWQGKQEVVVLTSTGVSAVTMEDQKPRLTRVQTKVDDVAKVIGFDPVATTKRLLALLVADGAGFAVVRVDLDSGVREKPCLLPSQVRGGVVAAELVRRGSSMMLAIVTTAEGSLWVHSLAWDDLAPQVDANRLKTLKLGNDMNVPDRVYSQQAVTVTSMRAGSTDQQLAVASGVTDTRLEDPDKAYGPVKTPGTCKIALVDWAANGEPTVLATATPDLAPAPPNWDGYLLTAGDLLHDGTEQLVFGYHNELPEPNRSVGPVLMLFTLDESSRPAANLKYHSKSTGAFDRARACDRGIQDVLELSAGVFGNCMGVQATFRFNNDELDQNCVACLFVPVDPNVGFSPITEGAPVISLVPLRPYDDPPCFFFASDLSGQNLVLGSPSVDQKNGCGQILAIIQAPPFDRRIMAAAPSVGFATSEGSASGCTVSSHKSWSLSDDVSFNLGVGPLSFSESIHNSYLNSLSEMNDSSATSNVQFHANFKDHDYLLVYEMDYNIWRYPVVRSSVKNTIGELLVVFPRDATVKTVWIPAHTYGYRPRSEVGMLLSYVDVERESYTEENRLFKLQGITVTEKSDTATITFDQSGSHTNTTSRDSSVLNSVSSHLGFTGSTELFDYVPATFGLNLGTSHSYSDSNAQTTHLTVHSSMSMTFSGGAVNDPIYEYQVTPYIYQHAKLGCLMLTWQVTLSGRGWHVATGDPSLTSAQICLIRPITKSIDLLYESFCPAISFVEKPDGAIDIIVEIFNNGLSSAKDVSCEFFLGQPELVFDRETHSKKMKLPDKSLGKVKLDGDLKPWARRKVTLSLSVAAQISLAGQKLNKPIYVSVKLYMGKIAVEQIYWAVYPKEKFFV